MSDDDDDVETTEPGPAISTRVASALYTTTVRPARAVGHFFVGVTKLGEGSVAEAAQTRAQRREEARLVREGRKRLQREQREMFLAAGRMEAKDAERKAEAERLDKVVEEKRARDLVERMATDHRPAGRPTKRPASRVGSARR